MPLLRVESETRTVSLAGKLIEIEDLTLYLGDADFDEVRNLHYQYDTQWRWKTHFPGMVETEDGVDVEGELGSSGRTASREEAIAALEGKAQRFLDYIGFGYAPFETAPKDRKIQVRFAKDSGFDGEVIVVQYDPDNPKGNEWRIPMCDAWFGSDNFDGWRDIR